VRFSVAADITLNNYFYVFAMSASDFVDLAGCAWASLDVGDLHVSFAPEQLEALRDLASRMRPPPAAPVGADTREP
jgi:hypothetical protein